MEVFLRRLQLPELKHRAPISGGAAAEIVEDMVGERISTLHMLGNVGAQVPQEASARL